ncbi:MAG: hypothetical protein K6G11_02100 [Lachnospiraceae bacterium]|nr:hypothetical protein [Lachnospiraceae bacterium]
MTKREFLDGLTVALSGRIPEDEIRKQVDYYNGYFESAGKTEAEVAEELGEPSIIARTVITGYENNKGAMADIYQREARDEYSNRQKSKDRAYESFTGEPAGDEPKGGIKSILFRFFFDRQSLKVYEKVIAVIIVVVAIAVILSIVAVILDFTFSVLLPIILVLLIVGVIMSFISRNF